MTYEHDDDKVECGRCGKLVNRFDLIRQTGTRPLCIDCAMDYAEQAVEAARDEEMLSREDN